MACRNAYRRKLNPTTPAETPKPARTAIQAAPAEKAVPRLLFGVDSTAQANDLLQNNIEQFEWVVRNKIYPNFYGRNLVGEDALTLEEIDFLHDKGCKIAPIYSCADEKNTEEQGTALAKKIDARALELRIPLGAAIFLELGENEKATGEFMLGFAQALLKVGYIPGFKANTDANYPFDREFSRGMQGHPEVFKQCLIWAVAPTVKEYDGMTTSHLIHPDNWIPFAPSCITRSEIAIWQYGRNCHPIEDDKGKSVCFNLDLVRNAQVITDKMF